MKDLIKQFDELPMILKIILALPALDIVWAIYRIVHGVVYKNLANIILGIVWIIGGCTITWVLDIIWIVLYNRVLKF